MSKRVYLSVTHSALSDQLCVHMSVCVRALVTPLMGLYVWNSASECVFVCVLRIRQKCQLGSQVDYCHRFPLSADEIQDPLSLIINTHNISTHPYFPIILSNGFWVLSQNKISYCSQSPQGWQMIGHITQGLSRIWQIQACVCVCVHCYKQTHKVWVYIRTHGLLWFSMACWSLCH